MRFSPIAERVAFWTLPPGIQRWIKPRLTQARLRKRLSPETRALLDRNRFLAGLHSGERCFILATGPSIKKQDLKLLKNETCIAVSNFFVHPDFMIVRPRYYCVAPYHLPITPVAWQQWLTELAEATLTGDTTLFFSLTDRAKNEENRITKSHQICYLEFADSLNNFWSDIDIDLTFPVPGPQSVTMIALMAAIYMGFAKIYLLGCDHDWVLHLHESRHFYDEQQHVLNRQGYNEWFMSNYAQEFRTSLRLWEQYEAIRSYAALREIQILNATDGGILDVFPRTSFQSLFASTLTPQTHP